MAQHLGGNTRHIRGQLFESSHTQVGAISNTSLANAARGLRRTAVGEKFAAQRGVRDLAATLGAGGANLNKCGGTPQDTENRATLVLAFELGVRPPRASVGRARRAHGTAG